MTLSGVDLTPEQEAFVASKVAAGDFADAAEVVRAALDTLERFEKENNAKEEDLERALAAGFTGEAVQGDVFARVRERAGLPPRDGR